MKIFKWIINFFNFGKKYRKREEEYHNKTKRLGTSGELITLILWSAIPLLSLWGAFKLPWEGGYVVLRIFCFLGLFTILYAPTELMITGIVALRHRLRMKVQNKIEGAMIGKTAELISGEEMTEEDKEKTKNYKAKGTSSGYDLAVGIIGITMSVVVVVAFITLFFVFLPNI